MGTIKCDDAFVCAQTWCRYIAREQRRERLASKVEGDFTLLRLVFKDEKAVRDWLKEYKQIREASTRDASQLLIAAWVAWRIDGVIKADDRFFDPKSFAVGLNDFELVRFEIDPDKSAVKIDDVDRGKTIYQTFLHKKKKVDMAVLNDGYESWEKKGYTPPKGGETFKHTLKKK